MSYNFTPDPKDHDLIALMADQERADKQGVGATPSKDPQQQFINKLVDCRLDSRKQQSTVAQKAGIPQSALARIEAGRGNPTLKTITKVADAMGYHITLVRKPR